MFRCIHCGQSNPDHARFCCGCAASLGTTRMPIDVVGLAGQNASPSSAADTDGQRQHISVLFADVAGSTAMVAGRDPEDARALLDAAVTGMTAAIHRFGGVVNSIAGDGLMALFGAQVALENHALCACRAALRLQADFALPADTDCAAAVAGVRVRVGISSGPVLLRTVASDLHSELTAAGATTHLAAKLQQAAAPGRVLVTAEVQRLVQGQVTARPVDAVQIQGLPPIEAFELIGETIALSRFEAAAQRGLSRFVSREAELAMLQSAADRAGSGVGQAVGVVGDAGLGKTRLLWEFVQGLRAQGWSVLAVHTTEHGVRSPFFAIRQLLQTLFGVADTDGREVLDAKIRRSLPAGDAGFDLPPLLALMHRLDDDPAWAALDARQRRERTRRAVIAALSRGAVGQRTAILIEDLHQADVETQELVAGLAGQIGNCGLLLLLEYRPGHDLGLDGQAGLVPLKLAPLPEAGAAALIRHLTGTDPSLQGLERRLIDKVAGNPFFIEESVRMLGETGALVGTAGQYRLGTSRAGVRIPETVRDVLGARIAHLSALERRVAQMAAVVGKDVHRPLLSALCGLDADSLSPVLQRLIDAELLQLAAGTANDALADASALAFRHAFTHEAVYDTLLKQQSKAAHASVVDWLESQQLQAMHNRVEWLAHHAVQAERWHQAVSYLQLAARDAAERSAMREAVRLLDEAMLVAARPPPEQRPATWTIDLRLALRGPLVVLGAIQRVTQELQAAEADAEHCDDPVRRCRVLVYVAGHRWFLGQHERAVVAGQRALALALTLDEPSLLIPVRQYIGGALHALGDHAAGQAMLSANVIDLPEDAPAHLLGMAGLPAVFCRATRCWSLEHQGQFEAATLDAGAALRIATASGHGFSIQAASFAAGNLHLACGEFAQAREVLQRGLAISDAERGMWLPMLGPLLALALVGLGDVDGARRTVDRTAPRPDEPVFTTPTLLNILEVYVAVGRIDLATLHAEAALQLARRRKERICEALSHRLLAEIAQRQSRPDLPAAAERYGVAQGLAVAMGMRPLAARCQLGLASVLAGLGRQTDAQQHKAQALAAFTALGLRYWVDCARALDLPAASTAG